MPGWRRSSSWRHSTTPGGSGWPCAAVSLVNPLNGAVFDLPLKSPQKVREFAPPPDASRSTSSEPASSSSPLACSRRARYLAALEPSSTETPLALPARGAYLRSRPFLGHVLEGSNGVRSVAPVLFVQGEGVDRPRRP